MTKLALGPVTPQTKAAAEAIAKAFPEVKTIGGYRPGTWGYHRSGQALDVMVYSDRALGDRIAAWAQANTAVYGIGEIIWQQRLMIPQSPTNKGWRPMEDRGSATANHRDHVHLSMNLKAAGGAPSAPSGGGIGQAGGAAVQTAAFGLDGLAAVGSFFAKLGERSTWIRIAQVWGGAYLLVAGTVIVGRSTIAAAGTEAVMAATPAGRVAGVASGAVNAVTKAAGK